MDLRQTYHPFTFPFHPDQEKADSERPTCLLQPPSRELKEFTGYELWGLGKRCFINRPCVFFLIWWVRGVYDKTKQIDDLPCTSHSLKLDSCGRKCAIFVYEDNSGAGEG